MLRTRSLVLSTIVLIAGVAFADANVQQKTHVQFSGVIGGVVRIFGGKAAREGVTSTTSVKGNKRLMVSDRTGELVDLGQEKIYNLDYDRKTYRVTTFDELRKQLEDAKKRAAEEAEDEKSSKKSEGPEYEVDFKVDETGEKQTINGFATKQVIATVTVREKGKKLEQSGGAVLKADMWMGPKIAAVREVNEFNQKYFKQLYGDSLAEMQQMAVLMATNPTFGKAMKEFAKKRTAFEGDAVRTTLTFETVAAPGQKAEDEESSESLVGGLIGRAMKKRQAKGEDAPAPGRTRLFESTTEVLVASGDAGEVALPAGFKEK
jgi:hypothetical protein